VAERAVGAEAHVGRRTRQRNLDAAVLTAYSISIGSPAADEIQRVSIWSEDFRAEVLSNLLALNRRRAGHSGVEPHVRSGTAGRRRNPKTSPSSLF